MRTKSSFAILAISVVMFFVIVFISISLAGVDPKEVKKKINPSATPNMQISTGERQQIDDWIYKNKLNPYGDPYDSVYTGGTPLFDEVTGNKKDRYQYILEQHPDRPWRK